MKLLIPIIASLLIILFLYWRFFQFFRDPERKIPAGNNIVSPADGTVVYVKLVKKGQVPISIKKGRDIKITDLLKSESLIKEEDVIMVGIFMHPTSVHINRSPISGKVVNIRKYRNKNLPMTIMWWRVLLGLLPYEKGSSHILENERNVILIEGVVPVYVVQIADIYVNKIVCNVVENQIVEKGQKIGAIIMGSQVDLLLPARQGLRVVVKEGDSVKAGESIIVDTLN